MKLNSLRQNGILLAIFMSLTFFYLVISEELPEIERILFALITLVLTLSLIVKKLNLSVFSPFVIVLICSFMTYFLRPAYLLTQDDFVSFVPDFRIDNLSAPLLLVVVFLSSLFFGYFIFKGIGIFLGRKFIFPFTGNWIESRLKFVKILLLFIAVFSYILMIRASGMTIIQAFANPFLFRILTTSGGNFYISGFSLWCIWSVFYLTVISEFRNSKRGKPSLIACIRILALFLVMSVLTFPYGSRGYIMIPVIGVLWISDSSNLLSNKRLNLFAITPVVIGMLFFSSGYGLFREMGSGSASHIDFFRLFYEGGFEVAISSLITRFDSFDFWSFTFERFSISNNFLIGKSLIDFFIQPIPRSIFPEKAYKTSAYLTQTILPQLPRTFTPEYGLITELYINFWIPGIILGGAIFGTIIRALETFLQTHRNNPSMLFWYAPLVTLPMGWFLAGFNSDASVSLLLNTVLSILVLAFITKKSQVAR